MKVRFQSRHGIQQVQILNMGGNPFGTWYDGEEKEIDPSLEVRVQTRPGAPFTVAKAIDAIFHAGPDFVDASTGKNPDFTCAVCGREALSQFFYDASKPDGTDKRVFYENEKGEPLCERDFLLAQPEHSFARRYHASVEHSTGNRELVEHLNSKADAAPVAVAPKPPTGASAFTPPTATIAPATGSEA
ncbi:MAG: hypothetical protein IAI48_00355 [Candidatus Eremiobacteraeota bacterium]|nr:hypothetical protein [Candidatus Eremiobacteraeota bacterium]